MVELFLSQDTIMDQFSFKIIQNLTFSQYKGLSFMKACLLVTCQKIGSRDPTLIPLSNYRSILCHKY